MHNLAKYGPFLFSIRKLPFKKKTPRLIVHGFVKNGVSRKETESNRYMLGYTSICPETTCTCTSLNQ